MKYFDMQFGFVSSHVSHFLGGAPSRDLIANMVVHELYDLHMSNISAMLVSMEESSFNLYTKLLTGRMINEEDLKRRDNILSMGVFIYKEICHLVEYFSSDASRSMLREKDVKMLTEVFPHLESLVKDCIVTSNHELPIFKAFSVSISDHPEFKWDDVKIDENDTDFPIDPHKYLDISDESSWNTTMIRSLNITSRICIIHWWARIVSCENACLKNTIFRMLTLMEIRNEY